ncbi:GMC family oxidoreductase N-terminal domain-containing protein [Mycobacterium sp. URHB0021]
MPAAAPEGVEHAYQIIDRDAQRQSAADADLSPVLGRANLDFVPNVTVDRLRIAEGRCTGVSYIAQSGMPTYVEAAQVVLAAGAIGSPQLLMLSGIGPSAPLREVGIEVIHDLPGVGRTCTTTCWCRSPTVHRPRSRPPRSTTAR